MRRRRRPVEILRIHAAVACLIAAVMLGLFACAGGDQKSSADSRRAPVDAFDADDPALAAAVDQEVTRLQSLASEVDRSSLQESLASSLDQHTEELESLRAVDSPLQRLYELEGPFVGIESIAYLSRNHEAGESIELLAAHWASRKADFDVAASKADGSLRGALSEAAVTASGRLFHASLDYGEISSPLGGLYYLSQAEGHRRFLDFLADLPETAGKAEPVPGRGRLLAVVADIESAALGELDRDPTSRDMIPVSVRLDEAREMLEAERPAGATLRILEAQMILAAKTETSKDLPEPTATEPRGSVGFLLQALAADDRQVDRAKIAGGVLLPLYDSMFVEAAESVVDAVRSVTLTLVRWPYT